MSQEDRRYRRRDVRKESEIFKYTMEVPEVPVIWRDRGRKRAEVQEMCEYDVQGCRKRWMKYM